MVQETEKLLVIWDQSTYQSDLENTLYQQHSVIDFEKLFILKEFDVITRSGIDRLVKPIFMLTVDRGSDESPRYQKGIKVAIHYFFQNDFDVLFITFLSFMNY